MAVTVVLPARTSGSTKWRSRIDKECPFPERRRADAFVVQWVPPSATYVALEFTPPAPDRTGSSRAALRRALD